MNKIILAAIAATMMSTSAIAIPTFSDGLYTLASTGWAKARAAEGFGTSYDKDGGKPGAFTYGGSLVPGYDMAIKLLGIGEFLAPHYLAGFGGEIDIMVAPHLLVDGKLVKGANPIKTDMIRIKDGVAKRYTVMSNGTIVAK